MNPQEENMLERIAPAIRVGPEYCGHTLKVDELAKVLVELEEKINKGPTISEFEGLGEHRTFEDPYLTALDDVGESIARYGGVTKGFIDEVLNELRKNHNGE